MQSWDRLLHYEQLTASYRSAPSLSNYFFTDTFYRNPVTAYGDTVSMISISATNTPGPMNSKGSAARVIQPKGGTKREFSLFHYFTELPIDPQALLSLRQMESPELQDMGRDVIQLQLDESAIKHKVAKEVILSHAMVYNRVNLDADGNILLPTVNATSGVITDNSSTQVSADFGVDDDHRGNLGGIIGAQWSTDSTSIMDHLAAIDRQAGIDGVPKPMDIYVNGLHREDLRSNTEFNDWAKYNTQFPNQVLQNFSEGLVQVFGKRWHFIDGTYVDSSGTTRDIMPQNYALMVPDIGPWLRPLKGRTLVPNDDGVASPSTPLQNFAPVEGEYAYAYSQHNPVRTSVYTGDVFGLGFANPNCVWVPKVFS